MREITRCVRAIIIGTCAVFLLQVFVPQFISSYFGLSLDGIFHLRIWQILTYVFLHGGMWHLFWNMLIFYFFGCEMEQVLGPRRFLRLYFGCGILAGVGFLMISLINGTKAYCIGASGAVYGVLGCFAAMFPHRTITLLLFFVLPVTLTARTMALGVIILSAFFMFSDQGNIAHSAHLFGCVAGYLYGLRIYKNPGLLDAHLYRQAGGNPLTGWVSDLRARSRRRKMKILHEDDGPPSSAEIDRILDKINEQGFDSLTGKERETLDQAGNNDDL